jgi:hypothetical protein
VAVFMKTMRRRRVLTTDDWISITRSQSPWAVELLTGGAARRRLFPALHKLNSQRKIQHLNNVKAKVIREHLWPTSRCPGRLLRDICTSHVPILPLGRPRTQFRKICTPVEPCAIQNYDSHPIGSLHANPKAALIRNEPGPRTTKHP